MKKRVFHNPVIGDKVTLIRTSEETKGEFSLLEVELVPGGGNALHTHDSFSEKFHVVEGRLTVKLGTTVHQLEPGESATVPAKAPHCFQNNSKTPVKFLVELRPAQPGFEKAIAIGYGLAADGLVNKKSMPRNLLHTAVLVSMAGTIPTGVIKLFMPLFQLLANFSKKTKAELVNKYC